MAKLTKSTADKKLCGVCGGVAKFFGLDATIVRIAWAICVFIGGFGLLMYLLLAILLPKE
ncbi:MAG: PspC domain-containing protein [Bacteroidales bacterium]|nr:PspC domain-containing protein [Bacteroidales bacterium]